MQSKKHLSALQRIALAVKAGYITLEQAIIFINSLHGSIVIELKKEDILK
jgi:hypothetical protein